MKKRWLIPALAGMVAALPAAEYHVDFNRGDNAAAGTAEAPLRTFSAAVKKVQPGDTIRLVPSDRPIHAVLMLNKVKGTADKPITVDGAFNILTGAARVRANEAAAVSPGLYRMKIKDPGEAMVWRFFMLFDGKQQRMGQHSKRECAPMKKPEELKPFEWTLLNRTDLYFRLPDGQTPETIRVEIPRIYNGVGVAGESEHIIVRNLIVKHVWNDGYNIHHASKNIAFENVAAIGCGDDSVSAHENCTISVKNLVAIGNGTGVCHGSTAEADHENMYIADSDSRDFFVLNRRNSFRNIAVEASAPATSEIGDKGDAVLENLRFHSEKPGARFRTEHAGQLTAKNVELFNYAYLGDTPGIAVVNDPVSVKAEIAKRKAELFAIFGDKLTAALAEQ
jgi:hypothetical protein vspiD_23880